MSKEIEYIRDDWQRHKQQLFQADFNHVDEEFKRIINFANNNQIIANILNKLRDSEPYKSMDIVEWINKHENKASISLGLSIDDFERYAQSLKIIDWIIEEAKELFRIGTLTYMGRSTKQIDYIHNALENIFVPLYNYVDLELKKVETLITPIDILEEIKSIVDNKVDLRYPETYNLLIDLYKQLFNLTASGSEVSWYQIGYNCRTVLTKFANEIFDSSYLLEDQDQPKKDDARDKLKLTARFLLRSSEVGDRYVGSIEKIIQANWDFVSNIGHRGVSTTEKDAKLAVIYTYLTIYLLDSLKNS